MVIGFRAANEMVGIQFIADQRLSLTLCEAQA